MIQFQLAKLFQTIIYVFKLLAALRLCCCAQATLEGSLGFSLWWLLSLWLMGLAAPRHVGASRTGDQTPVSGTDRRILYH